MTLLLHGARTVLSDHIAEGASVLIEGERIARVIQAAGGGAIPSGVVRNLSGLTLFPGFIDVHIHGAVGVDTMAASAEDFHRVSRFLAGQGVTGWLPTLVPGRDEEYARVARTIERVIEEQDASERPPSAGTTQTGNARSGARVLGVHWEGPFINTAQCGALSAEHFKTFSGPSDLAALSIPGNSAMARLITVAPEINGGIELIKELNCLGWIVSIGHTRARIEVLEQASEAGARHMTHFMNAMAPLHQRAPGPVGWGLARDDVTCDVIADGIHLDAFTLRLLLHVKTPHRLALISDAIAAAGLADGEYKIWGETITVTDGRTRNARGGLAGSVATMLDAARMMLSLGVSETDVARMAATNPARLLRIDKDCGSIEEGKRADLVALDKDRNVRLTIIGGRILN